VVLFVGMAETVWCCLWEWQRQCDFVCGNGRGSVVLFVGMVEAMWCCLWEW